MLYIGFFLKSVIIFWLMIKAVIFDYGHTLLDTKNDLLYPNVTNILDFLSDKKVKLALVSGTSNEEFRRFQLNELGIFPYFDYINFLPHEKIKNFKPILEKFNVKSKEVLVVGDRITSEITIGNKLKMKTCRILNGPEKTLIPTKKDENPDYTVENLSEVLNLV